MAATIATEAPVSAAKPWYRVLYVQVLIAIVLGALFGWLEPAYATNDWINSASASRSGMPRAIR